MKATLLCAFFAAYLAASYVVGTPGFSGGYGGGDMSYGMYGMDYDDGMMGGVMGYGMGGGIGYGMGGGIGYGMGVGMGYGMGFTGGCTSNCHCRKRCRKWERYAGKCWWCKQHWCRVRCCPKW